MRSLLSSSPAAVGPRSQCCASSRGSSRPKRLWSSKDETDDIGSRPPCDAPLDPASAVFNRDWMYPSAGCIDCRSPVMSLTYSTLPPGLLTALQQGGRGVPSSSSFRNRASIASPMTREALHIDQFLSKNAPCILCPLGAERTSSTSTQDEQTMAGHIKGE